MSESLLRCFCFFGAILQVFSYDKLLIDQLRVDFFKLEDELWEYVLRNRSDSSADPGIYIIKQFHEFDKNVQQMYQDPLFGMQVVRHAHPFLLLFSDLRIIQDMYEKFRRYHDHNLKPSYKDYGEYQRLITTSDIVDDILHDNKNNANKTVTDIFHRTFGTNGENLIWEVFEIISDKNYQCKDFNQPTQQVFYNLYNVLALADLKAYMMMQFGYLAQRLQEKGNNTEVSMLARNEYQFRANNTLTTFRGAIELTNGKVWRCDPKQHVEGQTYEQLTRLVQGHIQNEVDLNQHGTCTSTCSNYGTTSNYGCYDSESDYCKNMKPCAGKIIGCRFVESHFRACISPYSSYRRYEFIEYKSGKTLGQKTRCTNHNVNSWFRWFVHCSYCLCLCDAQGSMSDRYFNTRPVLADVKNNRVVTGLRIIKHNRIIHLQIQEGKLLPRGLIDNSTVGWKPVDDYKITDSDVKSGEDYHTMTFDKKSLFLDDLFTHETNHIITGVRFEYVEGHLRFQINVRAFDFKSGTLSNDSYYVYGTGRRLRINFEAPDIPTKTNENEPTWDMDRYIDFTHSDFDKDAAQTTVPFIDRQPVISYPAVPLKGAGIYYKGKKGYGGFIAPKITTYHYAHHLEPDFPEPKIRSEDNLEEFEVPNS